MKWTNETPTGKTADVGYHTRTQMQPSDNGYTVYVPHTFRVYEMAARRESPHYWDGRCAACYYPEVDDYA